MGISWFEQLFGFAERDYAETQSQLELSGDQLRSRVNQRAFAVGHFSTPSLAQLRQRAAGLRPGTIRVRHEVIGDVLELHALPDNAGALFQVASQLNCLEFAGPKELPEDGVTQYDDDPTQGPACALAAAAATVVRNYFVEVDGQRGQTRDRQLNNLAGLQRRLDDAGKLVEVRNGYTFSDAGRLSKLAEALAEHDRDALLAEMRIGVQTNVGVTFASRFVEPSHAQNVSQAFCSALSCGYTGGGLALWAPLATIVLDAAYEATLLAGVLDACEGRGSGRVWLTFLGGGAFGNDRAWIASAIGRALRAMRDRDLDVCIAHYRRIDEVMRASIEADMLV